MYGDRMSCEERQVVSDGKREREMERVMRANQLLPSKIVYFQPTYGADSTAMIKHFDVPRMQFLSLFKSSLSFFLFLFF